MDRDLQDFVQRVFACSPEAAAAIAARAARRAYAAREVVLRQGDACTDTWLVMAGRAQALVYGAEGQLVMLQEYGEGDLFGAIARLDPEPHDADVVAVEALRAALFLAADFLSLIETHSAVGLAVSRLLLRQLRAATGRMVAQTTLSAVGRVHAELLRLADQPDSAGVRSIRPIPVFSAMAVRLQTTRETVSRAVNALERRGILTREDGVMRIVAPRRLEAMVV
ncbi:MAG: cyclic nucleotide-binding domain-containing protein [Caulobacter sp.]|nr:cyclic nucleotide-binding domain-containing protein [Caulobacter sp.]